MGNPADSELVREMIARQTRLYGRPPRQAALDGGFASKKNLRDLKVDAKVKDVVFSKKRGLKSFKSYVWGSVVSANLLILARHTME